MSSKWNRLALCLALICGCGGKGNGGDETLDPPIDIEGGDGGVGGSGGGVGGACVAGGAQCNNCVDDDGDGLVNGLDFHCTGAGDDREDSLATGIPGDNIDIKHQDCFFDGNSGAGNDGCNFGHLCCFVPEGSGYKCPDKGFNRARDCDPIVVSQMCIDMCSPATPAGSDCAGCSTLCANGVCRDIQLVLSSPDCGATTLTDPSICVPCTKVAECSGGSCGGCVLCPGQAPETLPPECGGQNQCVGASPCGTTADCPDPASSFCSTGCCLDVVE